MQLRIFKILKNTQVEGPGKRYCIWVQGCSNHCKGCQATHTWSHTAGKLVDINHIIADIQKQQDIEGVTFLGGEPFEQAESLGIIAQKVQTMGLSVVSFSGNYLETLQLNKKNKMLLMNTDLLIDGPFDIKKVDYTRPWCGSSNQRYHFLSNKYNETILTKYKNKIEFNISKNGTIFMNGMGNFKDIINKFNFISLCNK